MLDQINGSSFGLLRTVCVKQDISFCQFPNSTMITDHILGDCSTIELCGGKLGYLVTEDPGATLFTQLDGRRLTANNNNNILLI
jgi:hypothetical protein